MKSFEDRAVEACVKAAKDLKAQGKTLNSESFFAGYLYCSRDIVEGLLPQVELEASKESFLRTIRKSKAKAARKEKAAKQ